MSTGVLAEISLLLSASALLTLFAVNRPSPIEAHLAAIAVAEVCGAAVCVLLWFIKGLLRSLDSITSPETEP